MKQVLQYLKHMNLNARINYRIRSRSIYNAHKDHRRKFASEYREIDNILAAFRAAGGLKGEFQAYKLWELSRLLDCFKPKVILEFGSGSSTAIAALYAAQHQSAVVSYDESNFWIENTRALIDQPSEAKLNLVQSNRVFGFDGEVTTVTYAETPNVCADFVLVDGPSLRINQIRRKDAVNSDVLKLNHLPRVIIVDGREATFKYLSEKLNDHYHSRSSDLHSTRTLKSGYRYFSCLVRRDT